MLRYTLGCVVTDESIVGVVYVVHPNGDYSIDLGDTTVVRTHDQVTLVSGILAEYDFGEQIEEKKTAIKRMELAQEYALTQEGKSTYDGIIKKYKQDVVELRHYQKAERESDKKVDKTHG